MDEWYIEGGGNYIINGEKVWGRNILIPVDQVEEKIRKRFRNTDAFATVYMYDGPDQEKANLYAPMYVDLDLKLKNNQDYQRVKRDLLHVVTALNVAYMVPIEYIRVYFSGSKGFHVMVDAEVFGITPCQDLNESYRALAHDLKKLTLFKTVDTGIYDRVRLFRLPNSINSSTGLYKVPIDLDFVRSSSYEEVVEYASYPREIQFPESKLVREAAVKFNERVREFKNEESLTFKGGKTTVFKGNGELLPCIKKMLNTEAPMGTRNKSTVIMASSLCQSGIGQEDALEMIQQWNDTHNSPRLLDREIRRTVQSAYDGAESGKGFGCRAIKELGMCVPTPCRVRDKAKG